MVEGEASCPAQNSLSKRVKAPFLPLERGLNFFPLLFMKKTIIIDLKAGEEAR